MTDKIEAAREAAKVAYPPGTGRLGGKLFRGEKAKGGFRERYWFEKGYLAGHASRDAEIAELRAKLAAMREPIWMLRAEHEAEMADLRGRLEAAEAKGKLAEIALSLAHEFEAAVASREPVGGMSVSPSGDFISCAQLPSAVGRMKWWAREIRKAQERWRA